jgi:hypothetical protein
MRVREIAMNVHAATLAKAHDFNEQTSTFGRDVIDDLSQQPKRLSPKYFYDAKGSELFEAITRQQNITRPAPNLASCKSEAARSPPLSRMARYSWNSAPARPPRSGCY